jgi:hypothetical protein
MSKESIYQYCSDLELNGETFFNLRGDYSTIVDTLKKIYITDPENKTINNIRNHQDAGEIASWCGFGKQTFTSFFEKYTIDKAIADYQAAKSKIEAALTRGKVNYSPVGESFSMGRYLSGHPVCAFRREKTKLPAKAINLAVNCSAGLSPTELSEPLALIAKAAGEYQAAGGLVTLTVNYLYQFSRLCPYNGKNYKGLVITIKIPLANPGILASAASVQFFRALGMPLGCYSSADNYDPLRVYRKAIPGYLLLDGSRPATSAVLAALQIG